MGVAFSNVWHRLFGTTEMCVLMLGLGAAGKTTILYQLKSIDDIISIPAIGFHLETFKHKNLKVWDLGSQDEIRKLWQHCYRGASGLIYVLDSSDRERIENARQELIRILGEEEIGEAGLLVFANKQDLPNAMTAAEVTEKLELNRIRDRPWYVQPACATTRDGLYEGLDWLSQALSARR
eukprot:CAMPEP_0171093258 /NCGR_PEP_ID=MMETSP0766_2-20121228/38976_1 /TAXON_ID=439317 /ORGANISM="Gambierdiscus australes, Strain CAWD 149" /LENGTH=179 /DNA_ID=CAMNT_0011551677 /DNA_START=59 /DNA_END=598 /DNA_ORIENTATION=-